MTTPTTLLHFKKQYFLRFREEDRGTLRGWEWPLYGHVAELRKGVQGNTFLLLPETQRVRNGQKMNVFSGGGETRKLSSTATNKSPKTIFYSKYISLKRGFKLTTCLGSPHIFLFSWLKTRLKNTLQSNRGKEAQGPPLVLALKLCPLAPSALGPSPLGTQGMKYLHPRAQHLANNSITAIRNKPEVPAGCYGSSGKMH